MGSNRLRLWPEHMWRPQAFSASFMASIYITKSRRAHSRKRSLFDPKRGSEFARSALPILFSDFIFYPILLYSVLLCLLLSLVLLLLRLVFLLLSLMCWYVLFMGVCRLLGRLLRMLILWLWTILFYSRFYYVPLF